MKNLMIFKLLSTEFLKPSITVKFRNTFSKPYVICSERTINKNKGKACATFAVNAVNKPLRAAFAQTCTYDL